MKKFSFLPAATAALLASCSPVCPTCHGTGVQRVQSNGRMKSQSCVSCNGNGRSIPVTWHDRIIDFDHGMVARGVRNTVNDHHYYKHGY